MYIYIEKVHAWVGGLLEWAPSFGYNWKGKRNSGYLRCVFALSRMDLEQGSTEEPEVTCA